MPVEPAIPANAYRGRFAPSPTGPLHFGSLIAAVGSYLDARACGGKWLLRIEDADTPRNVAGAADDILRTLEAFGFEWDEEVLWQSRRLEAYAAALATLQHSSDVYACGCSRREIADSTTRQAIDGGKVYPGTCRAGLSAGSPTRAWRMRVDDSTTAFEDQLQGRICQQLESEVGDFILLRADGQYAYQLTVVVDDAAQGITHVVRGADLIASTPRQIWLQQKLHLPTPRYAHLPVAANAAGEKLSKQTLAQALDSRHPSVELALALEFLGQEQAPESSRLPLPELWCWALSHWRFDAVPRRLSIVAA